MNFINREQEIKFLEEKWHQAGAQLIVLWGKRRVGKTESMMETEVLGYRAPLYGPRTGQWQIHPMTFDEVSYFRKGKSFEDRLMHYSVAGGIPAYWLQFYREEDFFNNITLQRHINFKSFCLGKSFLPVRDIRNMVMMSVVFDNFYGSFQSQRI